MYKRLSAVVKVVVWMVIADVHDDDDDAMTNDTVMLNDGRRLSVMFVLWPSSGIFAVDSDVDHTTNKPNKPRIVSFSLLFKTNVFFSSLNVLLTSLCIPDSALMEECGWSTGVPNVVAICWCDEIDSGKRTFTVSSIMSCWARWCAVGMDVVWK